MAEESAAEKYISHCGKLLLIGLQVNEFKYYLINI